MKCEKIIRENEQRYYVVLLEDRRCATVDIDTGYVDVSICICSPMVSGAFKDSDFVSESTKEKIAKILENPKEMYIDDGAQRYLTDAKYKKKIDDLLEKSNFYDEYKIEKK